jgi:hypothetical protein
MATAKITLSTSRDISFNKPVLSQSNVRRIKAGVSIEELAEDIARRSLLQSLNVRPVLDADSQETGMFEVRAGGRRFRALELLVKQVFHIVTGLLPPIWKRLPNESMRVYRLQTDEGERIIGRVVSPAWVAEAVECEAPTLSPAEAFVAVLDGRTVLQLQDGLALRRVKVMGEFRIELTGFTDGMVERLKAIGLISEIISWKLRLFVSNGASGPAILATLMARHPLVRIADKAAA